MAAGVHQSVLTAEVGGRMVLLKNTSVQVRNLDGSAATLFADDGTTAKTGANANVATSDDVGNLEFRAVVGRYNIAYTPPGGTEKLEPVWAMEAGPGLSLVEEILYNAKNYAKTPAQRAACGNGASKPLSNYYGTLAAAQVDYPHATALTNELDWAIRQAAIDAAEARANALPATGLSTNNGGATVFFPDGHYVDNVGLTVQHDGIRLIGQSEHGTVNYFNVGSTVDGITWQTLEPGPGGHTRGAEIAQMTLVATTRHTSVRDLLRAQTPSKFTARQVTFDGGARYGLNLDQGLDTTTDHCRFVTNNLAGLRIGASTSTATSHTDDGSYFHRTNQGPGADIDCLGATFTGSIFESNGELAGATRTSAHGILVRRGNVTLVGPYFENNAAWDVKAGTDAATATVSGTVITITNFSSRTGSFSLASPDGGHVFLDQYVIAASFLGGGYDVRNGPLRIHPSATDVNGIGMRWGPNLPVMSDGSDIMTKPHVALMGLNPVTAERYFLGRIDARLRRAYATEFIESPIGTNALPGTYGAGDRDTGLWWSLANQLSVVAGAAHVFAFNATANRSIAPLRIPAYASTARPAATIGVGAMILDSTLNKPLWSDGTNWRDATGTVV